MKNNRTISKWGFHFSYGDEAIETLCAMLFEPGQSLIKETYRHARRMLKGAPSSQTFASCCQSASTGICHDDEEICLLCIVSVRRNKREPMQTLMFVGPRESVIQQGNQHKTQIEDYSRKPGFIGNIVERGELA
jgi:hypothetical protein